MLCIYLSPLRGSSFHILDTAYISDNRYHDITDRLHRGAKLQRRREEEAPKGFHTGSPRRDDSGVSDVRRSKQRRGTHLRG